MNERDARLAARGYRKDQLKRVDPYHEHYNRKLKIVSPTGETNWLDITSEEYSAIRNILWNAEV